MISGLWHGANWKYLIWGLIHGCLLILYLLLKKSKIARGRYPLVNWLITFNVVCLAWVFFRADTVADAWYILGRIISFDNLNYTGGSLMTGSEIVFCTAIIASLVAGERYLRDFKDFSVIKRTSIAVSLVVLCYFFGIFNETQFIYFQF
jgi:D-alanyl-lipoteichoic acid acyltransferase DltB (MBOAT superfamily)